MTCIVRTALLALSLAMAGCLGGDDAEKLLADARALHGKGDRNGATIHLKNLLQKAPDNAEARYLLGTIHVEAGDPKSAEKELRRALELGIDKARVSPQLGKALLVQGEFKKLLDDVTVDETAAGEPAARLLTQRGLALLGLGRVQEARARFDQALVKQDGYADAMVGVARTLIAARNTEEATQWVERILAKEGKHVDALLLRGDLRRAAGDNAGATAAYQQVLEASPGNVSAHLSLASVQIGAGDYDAAGKHVDALQKTSPQSPMGRYMRALIEFRKNNFPAARDQVQQVLKVAPNHLPSVLLSGAVEFALDSQEQAQKQLKWVLERVPGNLYARKLLVASLAKSGQTTKALETLQPALRSSAKDPTLFALAGELYMQVNDLAKAKEYFQKAAELDPKSAGSRTGLALTRLASGDVDQAVADLESATQIDAGKFQADVLLIMTHLQARKLDLAMQAANNLEKKQPDNPLTHNLKAAVLLARKDIPGARASLDKAVNARADYMPAILNLAQLDIQDKKPDIARKRMEAVVEKNPQNAQGLIALANLGPRLGATDKEIGGWLERAAKAAPGSVQPLVLLARHQLRSGDAKAAVATAQQMLSASPDNPEALDTAGGIQMAAGDRNLALATYNKLVTVQPESPMPLMRVAGVQAAMGNNAGAIQTLRKALALKADLAEAKVAIGELEIREKRPEAALVLARDVQKQLPKSPAGFILEGDSLFADKKFPAAVKAYEAAQALGKSFSTEARLHGALVAAGRQDEGLRRLQAWVKAAPQDASAKLFLADAALKQANYRVAAEQYEPLLAAQPTNLVVLNNLAWTYQQLKDPRAKDLAERAFKIKPDNAAVADTLGWMLVEQGDVRRGIEILEKAVAAAPEAQEIRYHLALGWLKAGDKVKARKELEQVLASERKFPQHAQAVELLGKLR